MNTESLPRVSGLIIVITHEKTIVRQYKLLLYINMYKKSRKTVKEFRGFNHVHKSLETVLYVVATTTTVTNILKVSNLIKHQSAHNYM